MQLLSAIQAPSAIKACSAIQACSGITAIPAVEEEVVAFTNTYSVGFDGVDDYISIPDANELSFGDGSSDSAFSINVWVKFEVLQNGRLVSKRLGSTTGREYQLSYQSDKIQFTLYDQSESWAYIYAENTANSLLAGVWYHIVATYDGSGSENGLTLYVNNVDVTTTRASSGAYTAMENGTSDVYIGSNGYDATYCVDGLIDEVAIIGSELSAAQVSTIYGSEAPTSLSEYSPIGWWRMGDNDGATGTTITDQGSGGNNGTLTNGPTFSTDVPVYVFNRFSVDFDGVDDYVDCGDVAEINNASTITIQAWIKLDNTNNVFYIISKYLDNNNRIHIGGASNAIYFNVSNGGGQYGSVSYTSTDWNHVALVFDGNLSGNENRLKAYINGVQQTLSFSGTIQSTLANLSGKSLQLFRQDSYYGDGKIDEAAVFTSALSGDQISAIYNSGVPADLTSYSPVGWWRMGDNDDGTGTTITDQGSGANNGTLTNGPTFSTDIPVYRFNRYAVDFDGTDDYMSVPDSNDLSFGDASTDSAFSISAWVKMGDATRFRVVAKSNSDNDGEYIFVVNSADNLFTYLMDGGNSNRIGAYTTSTVTAYEGLWTHIAMTYDGGGLWSGIKLYINGVSQTVTSDNAGSYTAMHNTNAVVSVGRLQWNSNSFADGLIDEVSIFASELSAANISTIYNSGEVGDISSLSPIAHWRMGDNDDGTGTTITNQGSASGIDGTLTNGPTFSNDIPS